MPEVLSTMTYPDIEYDVVFPALPPSRREMYTAGPQHVFRDMKDENQLMKNALTTFFNYVKDKETLTRQELKLLRVVMANLTEGIIDHGD